MSDNSKPYVINRLTNKTAEVLIYDQIGESFFEEGITAKQFVNDLKAIGDVRRLDVRVNSPGGSVFDGLAIYNALKEHKAQVVVHIDGVAISMASVIAAAGDVVNIASNGIVMVHNPRAMAGGDANDLRSALQMLEKSKESLLNAYADKVTVSREEMSQLMDEETWMTPEDALSVGLVDHITGALQIAARVDLDSMPYGMSVPDDVRARLTSPQEEGQTMSDDQKKEPQAELPATLAQLKAMAGADSDFIVEQLEAGVTQMEALNALNAKLADELRVARTEGQRQEPAKKEDQPAPQTEPQNDSEPAADQSEGAEPIGSSNPKVDAPKAAKPEPDVFDLIQTEFRKHVANGMSADEAINKVHRDHPETLHAVTPTS